MGTFETAIRIAQPATVVFDVLGDTEQTPLWYEAVVSATKTNAGCVGPGSRYRLVRSLPGGLVENEVEITTEGLSGVAVALGPIATRAFKYGMARNLAVLKRLVES